MLLNPITEVVKQLVEATVLDEEIALLSKNTRGGFAYVEGSAILDALGENIYHVWAEVQCVSFSSVFFPFFVIFFFF